MLNPLPHLETSNINTKQSFGIIRNVGLTIGLILTAGCQTSESFDTDEIITVPEQVAGTYNYEGNSAYINFVLDNPLETDFYRDTLPNHSEIPNLRGMYEFTPKSDYYETSWENTSNQNAGEVEVYFFRKGIVEIAFIPENGNK